MTHPFWRGWRPPRRSQFSTQSRDGVLTTIYTPCSMRSEFTLIAFCEGNQPVPCGGLGVCVCVWMCRLLNRSGRVTLIKHWFWHSNYFAEKHQHAFRVNARCNFPFICSYICTIYIHVYNLIKCMLLLVCFYIYMLAFAQNHMQFCGKQTCRAYR